MVIYMLDTLVKIQISSIYLMGSLKSAISTNLPVRLCTLARHCPSIIHNSAYSCKLGASAFHRFVTFSVTKSVMSKSESETTGVAEKNASKTLVLTGFGGYEMMSVEERPVQEPGEGQVLVNIRAAGINFAELMCRQGLYNRLPKLPAVLGFEGAGEVHQVGQGVSNVKVCGMCENFMDQPGLLLSQQGCTTQIQFQKKKLDVTLNFQVLELGFYAHCDL